MPQVQSEIGEYLQRLRAGVALDDFQPMLGLIVEKGKLAANGEYNLSGERYRENGVRSSCFPIVPLGEVADVIAGQSPPGKSYNNAGIGTPFYQGKVEFGQMFIGEPIKWTTDARRFAEEDDVLMSVRAPVGPVNLATQRICIGRGLAAIRPTKNRLLTSYAFYILRIMEAEIIGNTGATFASINKGDIRKLQIPLPPLEVQKEIAAEIEGYQKIIDGARAVVDNYRPQIAVDPNWPMVELGEVCERLQYGLSARLNTKEIGYKTFRMNELIDGKCVDSGNMKCCDISAEDFAKYRLVPGDILFNRTNSFEHVGRTGVFDLDGDYCFASYLIRLSVSEDAANTFYVNAFMNTEAFQAGIKQYATRAIGQSNINAKSLGAYRIPVPPLTAQSRIVAEIEAEQALVNANRELIYRFEKKIQDTLARIWGDAEPDTAA